jgi:FMN reductase
MSLLLIAASPSVNSRSGSLLAAAGERLKHLGLPTRSLNLRELPARSLLHADATDPGIAEAVRLVQEARVIVLATPIYKAAYSGLLKVFLDLLPQDGFRNKVVWPLATAGSPAHLLALDYALRPVIAALGAREVVDPVFAADSQLPRRSEGAGHELVDEIQRRLGEGAAQVFERAPRLRPALERCSA